MNDAIQAFGIIFMLVVVASFFFMSPSDIKDGPKHFRGGQDLASDRTDEKPIMKLRESKAAQFSQDMLFNPLPIL